MLVSGSKNNHYSLIGLQRNHGVAENTKYIAILGISIATIAISLAAIAISLQSATPANTPNAMQVIAQPHYSGEKKEFWLFNSDIPDLNESKMDMPDDVYSMPVMAVFKGDKVVIHFFNTEGQGEDDHSFTIFDKPYNVNVTLKPGENTTITLDANTTGTFTYYCTFHQPTMRGQLIVQSPPY